MSHLLHLALLQGGNEKETVLQPLAKRLEAADPLPDYQVWIQDFVRSVLRGDVSPVNLLDLSPDLIQIVQAAIRQNGLSLDESAKIFDESRVGLQAKLDDLVERGYLRKMKHGSNDLYKAQFGRKRESTSSQKIWTVLDDIS